MPIKIDGRFYEIGSFVRTTRANSALGNLPVGTKLQLYCLHDAESEIVGLFSPNKSIPGWHDLDGKVALRHGWWARFDQLVKTIEPLDETYKVRIDAQSRGISLKNKTCRVICQPEESIVFVEFDEHVNGCSADGLGKAGHCVALPPDALSKVKEKSNKKE